MDQHYYKLIEDYSNKTIRSEDLTDLLIWVESSQQNQQLFRETLQAFEAADQFLNKPAHQQQSWTSIQQHLAKNTTVQTAVIKKISYGRYISIAAAAIVILMLPVIYLTLNRTKPVVAVTYHEIYNPKGQKRLVAMPDGSNIYLNGDSKIRYAQNFNTGKRLVYLQGEAFFDVQHRDKQPFVVYTGKVSTTVLGTSFNINAYQSAKTISITVQSGKVGVIVKHNDKAEAVKFLLPNEQLNIIKENGAATKTTVNAAEFDSWREYKLFFYNKPLSEIAEIVAREYDVKVVIKSEALNAMKLTAKFNKSTVNQVMEVIARLSGAKYKIYENKVIIYEQ
ncbi:FecR family protein [Pedobacter soli]|uniref:FecR family protein n=1 Tax=Pedobacter soli TaxID=390242 RepID=A0A1G6ZGY5_9SPHI|nr:FecR domain-containing protein [Pedobacter soli]SDE01840.1 FecR family protein [Pedobacter soli]